MRSLRPVFFIGLCVLAPLCHSTQAADIAFDVLRPGTYSIEVRGMLCFACADAIRDQLERIEGIENVLADFDSRTFFLTVGKNHTVPVPAIKQALRKASKKINLGTEFTLEKLRYSA